MTKAWRIVIKGAMVHCDDKGREHCDERDHGAMCLKGPWRIVYT